MHQDQWRRAEEIFHTVLDLTPERRANCLIESCDGDVELRRLVERLLFHDERAGDFLESPVVDAIGSGPEPSDALIGRRYGPYRIVSLLGAGGMGDVYRAHDEHLGRDVALKTLPPEFAADPERLALFRREAKILAALNHPNIAAIYGMEESQEVRYLVLELVEGETPRGPLPLAVALDVASQVAEGLEAAHEQGVIHRDLKPGNLKITARGTVKILDFGLAKALPGSAESQVADTGEPATRAGSLTGQIAGTPGYMSPEQASGRDADESTDTWAFGCLLYELLTGKQAFGGRTLARSERMGDEQEPDWNSLDPGVPEQLRALLRHCLEQNPDRRLRSIGDARAVIRDVQERLGLVRDARTTSAASWLHWPQRPLHKWLLTAGTAVGVLAVAVVGAIAVTHLRSRAPTASHYSLTMPAPTVMGVSASSTLSVTANGVGVVFLGTTEGRSQLYWQDLHGENGWPLEGTEDAQTPFLSPDARWLGFFRDGKILKLPLREGRVVPGARATALASTDLLRGAAWSEDGTIVYASLAGGLWEIPAAGGTPARLTDPDRSSGEISYKWPSFLPGGRLLLFTIQHASLRADRAVLAVYSRDTRRVTRLLAGGVFSRYLPTGHLVFGRDGVLLGAPFEASSLKITAEPVPVLSGVSYGRTSSAFGFDIAGNGTLVYVAAGAEPARNEFVWIRRDGAVEQPFRERRAYDPVNFALSPDGRRVAVAINDGTYANIWIADVREDRWHQLRMEADCWAPVWSPDGQRLVFTSNAEGTRSVFVARASGDPQPRRLVSSAITSRPRAWSPDGRFLAYQVQTPKTTFEMRIVPLSEGSTPWPWGPAAVNVSEPSFSPDGRWLAYQSNESGTWEVWVRPFPGPGPSQRVSAANGGLAPVWRRGEIYYVEGVKDTRIMSRRVVSLSPLRLGPVRVAFALPFAFANETPYFSLAYAVEPGARRVLVVRPDVRSRSSINTLNVVAGWPAEVRARLRQRSE